MIVTIEALKCQVSSQSWNEMKMRGEVQKLVFRVKGWCYVSDYNFISFPPFFFMIFNISIKNVSTQELLCVTYTSCCPLSPSTFSLLYIIYCIYLYIYRERNYSSSSFSSLWNIFSHPNQESQTRRSKGGGRGGRGPSKWTVRRSEVEMKWIYPTHSIYTYTHRHRIYMIFPIWRRDLWLRDKQLVNEWNECWSEEEVQNKEYYQPFRIEGRLKRGSWRGWRRGKNHSYYMWINVKGVEEGERGMKKVILSIDM